MFHTMKAAPRTIKLFAAVNNTINMLPNLLFARSTPEWSLSRVGSKPCPQIIDEG